MANSLNSAPGVFATVISEMIPEIDGVFLKSEMILVTLFASSAG